MIARIRPWLPAILWALLIFAVSSRPTLPVAMDSGRDKLAHFGAYAVLGYLLARGRSSTGTSAMVAAALGFLYAASDEWHQTFVPGRSADLLDWIADALGVLAGLTLHHWLRRRAEADRPRAVRTQHL